MEMKSMFVQVANVTKGKVFSLPTLYSDRTEACVCGQNYIRDRQAENNSEMLFSVYWTFIPMELLLRLISCGTIRISTMKLVPIPNMKTVLFALTMKSVGMTMMIMKMSTINILFT